MTCTDNCVQLSICKRLLGFRIHHSLNENFIYFTVLQSQGGSYQCRPTHCWLIMFGSLSNTMSSVSITETCSEPSSVWWRSAQLGCFINVVGNVVGITADSLDSLCLADRRWCRCVVWILMTWWCCCEFTFPLRLHVGTLYHRGMCSMNMLR